MTQRRLWHWAARGMWTLTVRAGLTIAVIVGGPGITGAHAFLVRTSPRPGERLATSPTALTLEFSEAILPESHELSVRTPEGSPIAIGPAELLAGRTALRAALPPEVRGIYVVSWRVRPEDGHPSFGEFAFAVGRGGTLPLPAGPDPAAISWPDAAASWLLLVGVALGLGGLASEAFVWRPVAREHGFDVPRAPVGLGLGLALLGAAAQLALLARARAGGVTAATEPGAWGALLANPPALLSGVAILLLAYALWILPLRRSRHVALLPLAGVAATIAWRGHSGTSGSWWAAPANAFHLTAAGLWVGALLHLVLLLGRLDRKDVLNVLGQAARRYARLALWLVVVAVGGGVATALGQFTRPAELVRTPYGWALLLKLALVTMALALALLARRRALPANPRAALPLLRRLTRVEALALVAAIGVSSVLINLPPPRVLSAADDLLGPPPLRGPVIRLASLAGSLAVYLAAAEGELEIQVITPLAEGAAGASLNLEARNPDGALADLYPRPCGRGCVTMRYQWPNGVTRLRAHVSAPGRPGGTVTFDVPWPPTPAEPGLLDKVIAAMRAQPHLVLAEQTFSGPGVEGPRNTYRLTGAHLWRRNPMWSAGRRISGGSPALRNSGSSSSTFRVPTFGTASGSTASTGCSGPSS